MHGKKRIILHIGPFKTGTTSVQRSLKSLTLPGESVPLLYPTRRRAFDHTSESLAPILATPPPGQESFFVSAYVRDLWEMNSRRFDRDWSRLVQVARESSLPVVISSENFALARADAAERIASDFRGIRITVIATVRPVSTWLASLYHQLAKLAVVPDFDQFVRACLSQLSDSGDWGIPRWMDVGWLRSVWEGSGADVQMEVVPVALSEPQRPLKAILRAAGLEDGVIPSGDGGVENVRTSLVEHLVWQRYLVEAGPTSSWVRNRLYERFKELALHELRLPASLVSDSYSLLPDVAKLVDRAFPIDIGSDDSDARMRLEERLASSDTLVKPVETLDEETAHELHRELVSRLKGTRKLSEVVHRIAAGPSQGIREALGPIVGSRLHA